MQIQFGVDTNVLGAVAGRGEINRYVNPEDPIITFGNPAFLTDGEILAVRIWFLIRAERPENGFYGHDHLHLRVLRLHAERRISARARLEDDLFA